MPVKAVLRRLIRLDFRRRLAAAMGMYSATRSLPMTLESQKLLRKSAVAFGGWCTGHSTRWWEYPWVIEQVRSRTATKKAAADFGAGKSPIPLALQDMGLQCTVVDPAQLEELEGRARGNEWDFVDYSKWGITTHRAGMEDHVFESGSLGFAVSVSVIEHMPAPTRREGLGRIADALNPGGYAVITVDLIRGSRYLWNRIVDEIESPSVHGTVDDLLNEARAVDLYLEHFERCPIRTSELEAVGLVFRKGGEPEIIR
jgi:SAM-dependent methyltransferase